MAGSEDTYAIICISGSDELYRTFAPRVDPGNSLVSWQGLEGRPKFASLWRNASSIRLFHLVCIEADEGKYIVPGSASFFTNLMDPKSQAVLNCSPRVLTRRLLRLSPSGLLSHETCVTGTMRYVSLPLVSPQSLLVSVGECYKIFQFVHLFRCLLGAEFLHRNVRFIEVYR